MHVCVCVCVHAHVYVCVCVCTHCVCAYVCAHVCVCVCVCVHVYACICIFCVCAYICAPVCICTCVCVFAFEKEQRNLMKGITERVAYALSKKKDFAHGKIICFLSAEKMGGVKVRTTHRMTADTFNSIVKLGSGLKKKKKGKKGKKKVM